MKNPRRLTEFGFGDYWRYGYDLMTTPAGFVDLPCSYVFSFNVASVDPIIHIPLTTDYDAPFIARSVFAGAYGNTMPFVFRYTDAEDRYLQNFQAPSYAQGGGNGSFPDPIKPNMVVPPGGVFFVDLQFGEPGTAPAFAPFEAVVVFSGVKRFRRAEAPEKMPRAWLDRIKEYRLSVPIQSGARIPRASVVVDDDAQYRLRAWSFSAVTPIIPGNTAGTFRPELRLRTNGGYLLQSDMIDEPIIVGALLGSSPAGNPIVLYPEIVIPPGGRIDVEANETFVPPAADPSWFKVQFIGAKRYVLE